MSDRKKRGGHTSHMKRAIISGATGAIGTALTRQLAEKGVEVLVLTRRDSARNHRILQHPKVKVRYYGLSELSLLKPDQETEKPYDVFYHFAWAGAAGAGRNDMYLQNKNVEYTLDAVAAAKRMGCHTFIGAGSQAEYGRCAHKLTADTPTFPEMGYGYAKLCAGEMTRDYARQLGLRHIWTRILSVYGPGDGEGSMISMAFQKFLAKEKAGFTRGEQVWDYLYSEDAANAFYQIGIQGKDGRTYILGNGTARPLREYIEAIRDLVSPGQEIFFGAVPYAPTQVMYLCADTSELEKDTGWKPQVSFEEGIQRILENWNR